MRLSLTLPLLPSRIPNVNDPDLFAFNAIINLVGTAWHAPFAYLRLIGWRRNSRLRPRNTSAPSNGLIVEGNVGIGTTTPNPNGLMIGGGNDNLVLALEKNGAVGINIRNSSTNNTFGLYAENDSRGNFASVGTLSNNTF
jgi:hypothetical protein